MPSRETKRISHALARCLAVLLLIAADSIPHRSVAHAGTRENRVAANDLVTVSVLGLFHPLELVVSAVSGHALVLKSEDTSIILENSSVRSAAIRMERSGLMVCAGKSGLRAESVTITGGNGGAEDFILEIPGKIKRRYHGTIKILPSATNLLALVTMDLETAVASVVAAEGESYTPPEALKAYAIAARSYLVAGRARHRGFDFCDTTHCQFLRTPPASTSSAATAAQVTRGLVLAYKDRPFAAMYTRSCSGQTRTPAQVGLGFAAYPYYSVVCVHCRQHPVRWSANLSAQEAGSLRASDEGARLAVARRLGWSAVPSNDFSLSRGRDRVLLRGVGNGHGIGLCQAGARAMAASGSGFREILRHYYPNSEIVERPTLN